MSELMVFTFESEEGAGAFENDLISAQNAGDIKLGDAALFVRQLNSGPVFSHAVDLVGRASIGGISGVHPCLDFLDLLVGNVHWQPHGRAAAG